MQNNFVNITFAGLPDPITKHPQNLKLYYELRKTFCNVDIICTGRHRKTYNDANLTIHYLPRNILYFIFFLIYFRWKNGFANYNCSETTIAGLCLVILKCLFRQNFTTELQGQLLTLDAKAVGQFKATYAKYLTRLTLKKSNRIRVVSAALFDDVVDIIPSVQDRLQVLPPRVDLKLFSPRKLHKRVGIIVIPARLVIFKGIKYALEAMAICSNRSFIYHIIGDGPLRSELEDLCLKLNIGDRVIFKGNVNFLEMPQNMAKGDFLLLPSIDEGFGRVIIEGMSLGIPTLGSNVGGIPSVITCGKDGILFDSKNPQILSEKIDCSLSMSDSEYNEMCLECLNTARKYEETMSFVKLANFYGSAKSSFSDR